MASLTLRVTMPLRRNAFTLVEALVAITIAAMAASVLLMGTTTSLQSTHEAEDQTMAQGMAQQLMDEIMGCRYLPDGGSAYANPIQPDASEKSGTSRQQFDDIGDFNGYRCQPPCDAWGKPLGTEDGAGGLRQENFRASVGTFSTWRQEVDVYYVGASDPATRTTGSQTSDYRAVEVRIMALDSDGQARELAKLRRVVVYVPPLP